MTSSAIRPASRPARAGSTSTVPWKRRGAIRAGAPSPAAAVPAPVGATVPCQLCPPPSVPARALAARQHRSTPLVDEIFAVAQRELALLSPASGQGKAPQYMLNREAELRRFLNDARIPLDNNISERALRTVALGRKGSLFVGPGDNGQDLAIKLTVLRTCELVGANPQHYLEDVLVKLRRLSARKDLPDDAGPELDALTPARWKAERDRQPS